MYFYPEHFPEQAWDVLGWLMRHDDFEKIGSDCITLYSSSPHDDLHHYEWVDHDGTAAGIRKAIVRAALRCVEGKP